MTVYLVIRNIPYEGSDVLGVFATFGAAKEFIRSSDKYQQRYLDIDEWEVEE